MKIYASGPQRARIYVAANTDKEGELELAKRMQLVNEYGEIFGPVDYEEVKIEGYTIKVERIGAKNEVKPDSEGKPGSEGQQRVSVAPKAKAGPRKGPNK